MCFSGILFVFELFGRAAEAVKAFVGAMQTTIAPDKTCNLQFGARTAYAPDHSDVVAMSFNLQT